MISCGDDALAKSLALLDFFASLHPEEGRDYLESVLLHANIDESGKFKDKDVICLTGIITTVQNWRVITGEWNRVLALHKIAYLHAKELKRWDGIYAGKKDLWGASGRDAVFADFAKVVHFSMSEKRGIGLSVSVDSATWRSLTSEQQRNVGEPSLAAFELFLAGMLYLGLQMFPPGFDIGLVCDDDQEMAIPTYKLLAKAKLANPEAKKRVNSLCFANDEAYPPLQMADLLANSCYGEAQRLATTPAARQDDVFVAMTKNGAHFNSMYLDSATLKQIGDSPDGITLAFTTKSPIPRGPNEDVP